MPQTHQPLKVRIFDGYAKNDLMLDLTQYYTRGKFSTSAVGFHDCDIVAPMPREKIWLALRRQNLPGYHYFHLLISEDRRTVWEGRIADAGIQWDPGKQALVLKAQGYAGSLDDQYYTAVTDWTAGGPHLTSTIIKEILDTDCPDINSNQDNMDATTVDQVGIDLSGKARPQDIILDDLLPKADSDHIPWYFGIWDDRRPWLKKRVTDNVDWFAKLAHIPTGRLMQQGLHLRNAITPVKDGTAGTERSDTDSQAQYPVRELRVVVTKGSSSAGEDDQARTALAERKSPRQDQTLTISGNMLSSRAATHTTAADGAAVPRPLWWVRAWQVLQIEGLVPPSVATAPVLDDLQTFCILRTEYDMIRDTQVIVPDRPLGTLGALVARRILMEGDKI